MEPTKQQGIASERSAAAAEQTVLEVIVALACVGTAVVLYPVVRMQYEGVALGFVGARVPEAATIFAGVVGLLTVVTHGVPSGSRRRDRSRPSASRPDEAHRLLGPQTIRPAVRPARYLNPEGAPSDYSGNIAATHHQVTVPDSSNPTANFTAPQGGIVTGKMRYARNHRPLIAPVGYEVLDRGDQSWLFPTVSSPQRYANGFRVDRLHRGRAVGRLLDLQALLEKSEETSTAVPQTLLASARIAELGTPYWLQSRPRRIRILPGQVTDVGWVDVKLRR